MWVCGGAGGGEKETDQRSDATGVGGGVAGGDAVGVGGWNRGVCNGGVFWECRVVLDVAARRRIERVDGSIGALCDWWVRSGGGGGMDAGGARGWGRLEAMGSFCGAGSGVAGRGTGTGQGGGGHGEWSESCGCVAVVVGAGARVGVDVVGGGGNRSTGTVDAGVGSQRVMEATFAEGAAHEANACVMGVSWVCRGRAERT